MFVVVGAHGKTGGAVVRHLLADERPVRAVVRRPAQAEALRALGADVALGDVADVDALTRAFEGADAVYALSPPAYQDADMFARARTVHSALVRAAAGAGVGRVVALSSVGAQHAEGTGNILTTHDLETQLAGSGLTYTVLRAANFIENWGWVFQPARDEGVLPSMLHPLDRRIPSVGVRDVGEAAARLMAEGGPSGRVVELHGPAAYSADEAADALSSLLRRTVRALAVPEAAWVGVFTGQGIPERSAVAFAEMYRGFNTGHIAFEGTHETWRGSTTLEQALADLVRPAAGAA